MMERLALGAAGVFILSGIGMVLGEASGWHSVAAVCSGAVLLVVFGAFVGVGLWAIWAAVRP